MSPDPSPRQARSASRADVNDYLIGEIARREQATTTYTFDRRLRRAAGFTWLAGRAG
jgi:predicted nucleic acid-binding protein